MLSINLDFWADDSFLIMQHAFIKHANKWWQLDINIFNFTCHFKNMFFFISSITLSWHKTIDHLWCFTYHECIEKISSSNCMMRIWIMITYWTEFHQLQIYKKMILIEIENIIANAYLTDFCVSVSYTHVFQTCVKICPFLSWISEFTNTDMI